MRERLRYVTISEKFVKHYVNIAVYTCFSDYKEHTLNILHDNHDGLPLGRNSDKLNDVGVVVAAKYTRFLYAKIIMR